MPRPPRRSSRRRRRRRAQAMVFFFIFLRHGRAPDLFHATRRQHAERRIGMILIILRAKT